MPDHVDGDLSLLGIQWRESFEPERLNFSGNKADELAEEFVELGRGLTDGLTQHAQVVQTGDLLDCMAFSAVADTINIGVLSRAVRSFIEDLAFAEDICYNTDLVVSEALTNVMVHGFKDNRPEPVLLVVLAFQNAVGVLVEDRGSCIPANVLNNMRQVHSFQDDLELGELPEGGMGLAFMRMVSQRFVYQSDAGVNRLMLLL